MANPKRKDAVEKRWPSNRKSESESEYDELLTARIRSAISHAVTNPGAVRIAIKDGTVSLSGPILKGERQALLQSVRPVEGVLGLEDRLDIHEEEDKIPGIQHPSFEGRVTYGVSLKPIFWIAGIAAGALGAIGWIRHRNQDLEEAA